MPVAEALPTIRPRYPGQLLLAHRRNPLDVFRRAAATGHDAVRLFFLRKPVYFLNHPDLVQELLTSKEDALIKGPALRLAKFVLGRGLLTSEGTFHHRQRKLVLPAFHYRRITAYADVMVDFAAHRHRTWCDDTQLYVDQEMMRLTLEVAAKTLLDADVRTETGDLSKALTAVLATFKRTTNPLAPLLNRLPLPSTIRMWRGRRRLNETVYRLIRERRAERTDRGDLLSMLLAAQEEDTGRRMTDQQVRDEVMTLFLAGHETTAVALTWTWYLLAQHPAVEEKLHDEVDAVLGCRRAGFGDLDRLVYTRQVFSEAMRLYPPVWAVGREAARPVTIGRHCIPKGAVIVFSQYLLHRRTDFWPDPECFAPERFASDAPARHKFAYLPFSMGRRGCIGEQFAWTEGLLILATLAQRWRVALATEAPVDLKPGITLRPARSIPMVARART